MDEGAREGRREGSWWVEGSMSMRTRTEKVKGKRTEEKKREENNSLPSDLPNHTLPYPTLGLSISTTLTDQLMSFQNYLYLVLSRPYT